MKKIDLKVGEKLTLNCLLSNEISEAKTIIIHLNGINFSSAFNRFWKIPTDLNATFAFIDLPGNDVNLKSSKYNRYYLKIINQSISVLRSMYQNIQKVYMTGESWGANLSLLFAKKYTDKIDGVLCWNGPSRVDTSLSTFNTWQKMVIGMRHFLCVLFNTNTFCSVGNITKLTDNPIILRIFTSSKTPVNGFTRLDLAAWYSMFPAFHYLKKHFKSNLNLPITYIQTENDCYYKKNIKKLNKIKVYSNDHNRIVFQKGGEHLLSVDPNGNNQIIWKELKRMIGE